MSTVRSAVQFLKAPPPITFTPSRSTTFLSPVQYSNMPPSIIFTLPGITTSCRARHSRKALWPISSTESGMAMSVSFSHHANA